MRARLLIAVAAIAVLWGIAFVAIKEILRDLSPVSLVIVRFAIADAVLIVVMVAMPRARPRFERPDRWRLVVLGITGVPMYHLALVFGEQHTSAQVGALVVATAPIMVALTSPLVLRERITTKEIAGILLAFTGVSLLAFGRKEPGGTRTDLAGFGVELLAPVAWAIYTLVAKPLLQKYEPLRVTATTVVLGSLMVFPMTTGTTIHEMTAMRASSWGWIVVLGIGSSALGYLLFVWVLSRMDATRASVLLYAVPVVGVVSAWLIRDEPLGFVVLAAAVLVIGGVWLVEADPDQEPAGSISVSARDRRRSE